MNKAVASACERYRSYCENILHPAADSFRRTLEEGTVRLHHAFGANLFAAHAIDYLLEIRIADGLQSGRKDLVTHLDQILFIGGGRFQHVKFQLIDAINNALKHIQLDPQRHHDVVALYGPISFECLTEDAGRVLCLLEGYRFDYSRVVLRPVLDALVDWEFDDLNGVLDFARGTASAAVDSVDMVADDDPIDEMIEYCNPVCGDCGEDASHCVCARYTYDGESGEFAPIRDESFDFDDVMSRISGSHRREGQSADPEGDASRRG